MNIRYRLARWLVGPFLRLPVTGSWFVHRDAEQDWMVAIKVAEWHGTLNTRPPSYDGIPDLDAPITTGEFSGKFAA